jgi:peptidoglycan biosynthesis protein MviN/MurJ (putative lipid II flippase)
MAAFPTLSRLFASNEKDKFVRYIATALRHIIFLSLPAMALFIVVRAQIVRTVLGSGAFSWSDTRLTAACLALFAISIVAQNANLLFFRAYYAAGKTKTPLIISGICSIFTIIISYVFYKSFYDFPSIAHALAVILKIDDISGIEVISLPLGFTIGNLLNLVLFVWIFDREFKHLFSSIRKTIAESAFASIACGVAAYFVLNWHCGQDRHFGECLRPRAFGRACWACGVVCSVSYAWEP